MKQHYHVIVRGRVQGVFFRATVKKKADLYELQGTVQNLKDGSVEIFLLGEQKQIDLFFQDLKENSGAALITDLYMEKTSHLNSYQGFSIIR